MPTKTAAIDKSTTTRAKAGKSGEGAGAAKRMYVGRIDGWDCRAYFGISSLGVENAFWSGVGKITRAYITFYVDDGFGILGDTMPKGEPQVRLARVKGPFDGGSHAVFHVDDYTVAAGDGANAVNFKPTRGSMEAVNVDVTALVGSLAPSTVKTARGGAGGKLPNYGFVLTAADTNEDRNWAIFSDDEDTLVNLHPVLTLEYEYGTTAPDVPDNLAPSGSVGTLDAFEGDFHDIKTSDKLAKSNVQVWPSGAEKSGTAGTDGIVHVTGHGYKNGTAIYFTSLTGGAGFSRAGAYYVRDAATNTFKVALKAGGTAVAPSVEYTALKVVLPVYNESHQESEASIDAARFSHCPWRPTVVGDPWWDYRVPSGISLRKGVAYYWRARVLDSEAMWSDWTAPVSFTVTNTAPNPPQLYPNYDGDSLAFSSLANVKFHSGAFSDPDSDKLSAYEIQLSAYPSGDAHWLDDDFILWNTGKVLVAQGRAGKTNSPIPPSRIITGFATSYGGPSLSAGTYYWRARVYDEHGEPSAWAYAKIVLSADFEVEANKTGSSIQVRPVAPWRIVIRNMKKSDGTPTAGRGPGQIVAIIEDAKNVGASLLYNSPGEAHWTLGTAHPQLSVIEPKQTHYAIEFRQGDGWREAFAGLVWDFDATDRDVVFYGLDYLALLDRVSDERYITANPDTTYDKGGSKYVSKKIKDIVLDQLKYARNLSNSPVGFISTGAVATMDETLTVYSTYQPILTFVTQLLDSHRAGRGYNTRLSVQKTAAGGYEFVVQDNPGVLRDNLRLRYGELVQGYRVVPFGNAWFTRVNAIGRDKDGLKVRYTSKTAAGLSEATWGRFMSPTFIDGVSDANDLERRAQQMVNSSAMLGRQVALGLRSGVLLPRDGYDLMDLFPVDITHGSVRTANFGHDGQWIAVGITWQALERGDLNTTLTLVPKETGSPPSSDLLVSREASPQKEWQVGWKAPDPLKTSSRYWLDQSTGKVYQRVSGTLKAASITGTK